MGTTAHRDAWVKLLREAEARLCIPAGYPYDFGTLIDAQSIGDLQSLRDHGRRVLRVEVHDLKEVR